MKKYIRLFCIMMALVCLVLPPLQVSADVAYYPGEHEPGENVGTEPARQSENREEERLFLVLTVVIWIAALVLLTFALLLWLKRK